jgi:hypothetical protein
MAKKFTFKKVISGAAPAVLNMALSAGPMVQ